MRDRYGYDDVDLSDMPYADDDGIIHHPGMGDDPRALAQWATRRGMRITTQRELDAPRALGWSAIDDRTYDGDPRNPIGRGPTEADAIRDLLERIDEREGDVDVDGDAGYDAAIAHIPAGDEDMEPDVGPHPHTWALSAESATEVCTECGTSRPLGPRTE